jgi:hypothetical protein
MQSEHLIPTKNTQSLSPSPLIPPKKSESISPNHLATKTVNPLGGLASSSSPLQPKTQPLQQNLPQHVKSIPAQ